MTGRDPAAPRPTLRPSMSRTSSRDSRDSNFACKQPGSVREWAQDNNESMYDPDARRHAFNYLVQLTNFRSRHLEIYLDDFKDDPDTALPHMQMFLAMPAKSVAQSLGVVSVSRDTSIAEASALLVKNNYLVVRGSGLDELSRDSLWDQKTLFFRLIGCNDFEAEVDTILDDVQELPTMHCKCRPRNPVAHLPALCTLLTILLLQLILRVCTRCCGSCV